MNNLKIWLILLVLGFFFLETLSIAVFSYFVGFGITIAVLIIEAIVGYTTFKKKLTDQGATNITFNPILTVAPYVVIIALLIMIPGFFSDFMALLILIPKFRIWFKTKVYPTILNMIVSSFGFDLNGVPGASGGMFGNIYKNDTDEDLDNDNSSNSHNSQFNSRFNKGKKGKVIVEDAEYEEKK